MLNALTFASRIVRYFVKTTSRTAFMKTEEQKRKFLVDEVHKGSQAAMRDLGFEIEVFGYDKEKYGSRNFLTVGNHVSYLDPFILAAVHPTLFVTSVDMGETVGLGHVCHMAGCIFVERRNRTTIEKDIGQMTEALKQGLNVTIYPEGTSSNGHDILPFKKSLLMSAVFAQRDILPVVIKYTQRNGEPVTKETSDEVHWYGDMSFTPHFLNLMKSKSLKVQLHFLEPIKVTPASTRQDLAAKSYEAIRSKYLSL